MQTNQALQDIRNRRGISYGYLERKLVKSRQAICRTMLGSDIYASNLIDMADAMDYEVVLRPKRGRGVDMPTYVLGNR